MSLDLEELLHRTATPPVADGLDLPAVNRAVVGRRLRQAMTTTAAGTVLAVLGLVAVLPTAPIQPSIVEVDPVISPSRPESSEPTPSPEPPHDVTILGVGPLTASARHADVQQRDLTPTPHVDGAPGQGGTQPFAESSRIRTYAWGFADSLEGWEDYRGRAEMDFWVFAMDSDPRRGWRADRADGNSGGSVHARRINGAVAGGFASPMIVIPATAGWAQIQFSYRWTGQGNDRVEAWANQTTGEDLKMATLQRGETTDGQWTTIRAEFEIGPKAEAGSETFWLSFTSYFDEPAEDCTGDPDDWKPACDLGFWLDDVSVEFHAR